MDEEILTPEIPQEEMQPAAEQMPPKPKRTRKKKVEEAPLPAPEGTVPMPPDWPQPPPERRLLCFFGRKRKPHNIYI